MQFWCLFVCWVFFLVFFFGGGGGGGGGRRKSEWLEFKQWGFVVFNSYRHVWF